MSGAADSLASADSLSASPLEIEIDNDLEPEYTLIRVEGRGQGNALLAALSSGLQQFGVNVNSAAQESEEGKVVNVFKVSTTDGGKVPRVSAGILCSLPRRLGAPSPQIWSGRSRHKWIATGFWHQAGVLCG